MKKEIKFDKFLRDTKDVRKSLHMLNFDLMEFFDIKKFFIELNNFLEILKEKDIYKVKKFIDKSKILFKGTYGIGINYYIGKKT